MNQQNPNHDAAVRALPPDWRELYEERAAIKEYDGNMPRELAERSALNEIQQRMDGTWRVEK